MFIATCFLMEKNYLCILPSTAPVFECNLFTRKVNSFCKTTFMNSDTILQSNLLDIIFENRNKEYGAYRLRKFYCNRLSIAVLVMAGVVFLFSLFQIFGGSKKSLLKKVTVLDIPDYHPSKFENKPKAILFPVNLGKKKIQKKNPVETTPRIVDEKDNINKLIASIGSRDASDLIIPGNEQLAVQG